MPETLFKTILLAVDGSENAYKAAHRGIIIGKQNNAEIFVLYVLDASAIESLVRAQKKSYAEIKKELREMAKTYLHDIEKLCKENQLKSTLLIEEGPTVNVILRVSKQYNIDLIILAHHSHIKTEQVRMETVCSGVLEFSPCPVLIFIEKKR